jgi:hypothetical protein
MNMNSCMDDTRKRSLVQDLNETLRTTVKDTRLNIVFNCTSRMS